MSLLGERIKAARIEQGLAPVELARAVGVTGAAVSRWESGFVKNLKMLHLFSISRLLNVNPEWLATGQGAFKEQKITGQEKGERMADENLVNSLTDEEQVWVNVFRRLSPDCRKNLREAFTSWVSEKD